MNRTERLYALVEALRAGGRSGANADALASRFEVSARTIKRDIAALRASGVDVDGQDGRGGGYQLDSTHTLPPVTFTDGEALALAIALASEPHMPFALDGGAALHKVLEAMGPGRRAQADDLASRVWMRTGADTPRPAPARVLDEALRLRLTARIDYVDGDGVLTQARIVEPMAFARMGAGWYLLAWCRTRDAGRWFRLERIKTARLRKEPAQARDLREVFGEPPADAQPISLGALPRG